MCSMKSVKGLLFLKGDGDEYTEMKRDWLWGGRASQLVRTWHAASWVSCKLKCFINLWIPLSSVSAVHWMPLDILPIPYALQQNKKQHPGSCINYYFCFDALHFPNESQINVFIFILLWELFQVIDSLLFSSRRIVLPPGMKCAIQIIFNLI